MVKWKIIFLVVVLIKVLSAVPYKPFESDVVTLDDEDDSIRLPKSVIPIFYDLWLTTNVHTGERAYTGDVKIRVKILSDTNSITLHNRGLTITYMQLKFVDTDEVVDISYSFDTSRDFLIISTAETVLKANQEYLIEIEYSGNLRTDLGGFYRSLYYVTGETMPRYVAATQFQSTSARTAFPCFDEPALKAIFKLTITHASHYEAISNMDGYRNRNDDGTTTTSFGESPVMSSYLLAFVVSDFAYRSLYNGPSKTEHRVYAREEDVENVALSLYNSDLFLRTLEEYCNYKYELPKMYSAAIPDFAAGAMENWGMILYKEQYLIVSEDSHPRETLDMWRVTAHELGHQFFGNVVTYDWWDKIWLNEGFATFFEYHLPHLNYPEERFRDQFNVRKTQNAFRRDSLHSTAPMTFEGNKPTEINYDKGGAVIRMFQYTIGDDLFRAALNKYLNDNHHRPVATEDLLKAFEDILDNYGKVQGLDFSKAFRTWELQKGYPMITVNFNSASKQFAIKQSHYLSVSEEKDPNDDSSWYIPLSYTTGANPNFENIIFTDYFVNGTESKTISTANIQNFDESQWYVFNIQQMGYYRVNYDENNWKRIIEILNSEHYQKIHVLNRAQLVDDALTFAFDGVISYEIALGVVSYLERETDFIPWYPATMAFEKLNYILKGSPLHASFQRFLRKLLRRSYVENGLEHFHTDSTLKQFARELSIDWTCRMGDQKCRNYAYSQLSKEVPKPLELTLLCNGLKGLNRQTEFVNIYKKFQAATDQNDRLRYIDILLCSSDPKPLGDFLETTLGSGTESFYRAHEKSRIYANVVSRSEVGLQVLLDFIVRLYDEILSWNGNVFDSWLISASNRISSVEDEILLYNTLDKLEAMGKPVRDTTKASIKQNIQFNRNWTSSERYQQSVLFIESFLKKIDDEEQRLRLPETSEPQMYRIKLNVPDIHKGGMSFSGDVTIDIMITKDTDRIMFHSRQHVIDELTVLDSYGNKMKVLDYSIQIPGDSLTIYFMDVLKAGTKISVNIKYIAVLNQPNSGFYRTYYTEEGTTKYLAATQFQPTGARHAFPNYDEPGFKTPFEISIRHDKSYTAISNTFGISFDNGDGTVTTEFERTPMMSTYLVAFVISDFAVITNEETRMPRETLHRIWTKPGSISKAYYALDSSVKVLKALEDYCYFEYALPKVDSAAVPLKSSAMENWGMVTYWESVLIQQEDYNNISHSLKYTGVTIIAHELAHQFFGDAVTCKWWDQIWLNEGFATLFEHILLEAFEPTWRINDFMTVFSTQNRAFISDSRDTTRPMTWDVNTLSEISNSFDRVAYEKSGAVLRMFLHAVGENVFRRSLQRYLKDNNYQPVVSKDLIEAIVGTMKDLNAYKFDFERCFKTWEHQKGYPVLNVHYNPATSSFHLKQERFFETKKVNSDDESSWFIPINFATFLNPNFNNVDITHYFEDGTDELTIPISNFDSSYWYVFNKQQYGYYRVNYDEANWRSLVYTLNSNEYSKIHVMNRVQLIDDAFALAQGGYINDYSIAYDIVKYLEREDDFFPWYTLNRYVNQLFTIYGNKNQKLIKFFNKLSEKFYSKFTLNKDGSVPFEDLPDRYGRDYAILFACNNRNEKCLHDAEALVEQFAFNNKLIPNGLERLYCSGLRGTGKQDLFAAVWNKMSNTEDATFKSTLINALGCSDDPKALNDYLDSSIGDGNNVNYTISQRYAVFNAVLSSYSGLPVVLDFLKREQDAAANSYGVTVMQILRNIANSIKNEQDQLLFHSFLLTRSTLSGDDFLTISRVVSDNLEKQKSDQYMKHMSQIERVLNEWEGGLSDEGQVWRLPKTSKPFYYKIHLDVRNIHTGNRAYTGDATIHIDILEKTDRIVFHSKNQVFNSISAIDLTANSEISISNYRLTPAYDTILIFFAKELPAGSKISVNLKYSTSLTTSSDGFFQSSYSMDGRTRYLGATQFEETGARYAFPCYDEPEFKAVFELSFTHDTSLSAFSNTIGTPVDNADGTFTTSFEPSPIMSSYLNAFVISDLKYIDNSETKLEGETLHRIIVREDSLEKAPYALVNSIAALKALEEYVDFKYELSKVDSAGVPGKSGAMENWGMVIYSESAMIYNEDFNNIPHSRRFSGVRVISHELAHQFFGNAVTCSWWSYIWLNEGFAQLLQYTLTDMFQPGWRMKDFMNILAVQNTAFRVDARTTTRAMTTEATTPREIDNLFDSIAYDKSASVLRTFEHAIGEKLFRQALHHYISTYNHRPAVSQNLIDSFKMIFQRNNYSSFDFERAFRSWELQKGYPVVNVIYDYEKAGLKLTQERFFERKSDNKNDESSWYIPLNYATEKNPNFDSTLATDFFLNGDHEKIIPVTPGDWYVFNIQQRGYYRVNYEQSNWDALSEVLIGSNYNKIHVMNRAQLIDDSFALVNAGYLDDYQTAYNILKYLINEDDYFPWYAGNRYISPLYSVFGGKNVVLNNFMKKLSAKLYEKYKLPGDYNIPLDVLPERYGRELAINLACTAGNEQCLTDTYNLVHLDTDHDRPIPNGLETIYCHGMRGTGKQNGFVKLWRKMQLTSDPSFKNTLINALGCSDDPQALTDYLESSLGSGESQVNYTQAERRAVFNAVLKSNVAMPVVVKFLDKFELDIISRYGWTFQTILNNVANSVRTADDQLIFQDYLLTLDHLSSDSLSSLLKIMSNNMSQQKTFQNARQMEIIRTISNEWEFGIVDGHKLRLPKTSWPEHYKVHFDVRNFQTGARDYSGDALIDITMLETSNHIIFHSKNQVIHEVKAHETGTSKEIKVSGYRLYPSADTILIFFENPVYAGSKISVNVKYSTSLLTTNYGFYQTSYEMYGKIRYVAITQFEPARARYAFPCYDEPEFKATFEFTFTHHFSVSVQSNTMELVEADNDGSGLFKSYFKPTPKMSSYLIAFAVSDFTYIDNSKTKGPDEPLQRILVPEDAIEKADYALENSINALKALEEYVGFKYNLEKLDSIAVPGKTGAMENWGLITYAPSQLIYDVNPMDVSHTQLYSGVRVIAHEVTHQFFGNAVTCRWWDNIWLNEGYARFLNFKLVDKYHPDWRMMDFMNIFTVQATAFTFDSTNTTRAMTTDALTPAEISNLFDNIAYDKSGSVLRMFEFVLGESTYRQALNLYITRNNLKSVTSDDYIGAFVETIARVGGAGTLDFKRAFESWEHQKGYPVIHVTYMADTKSFRVTQERFFRDKAQRVSDRSSWYIPINYATAKNPDFEATLPKDYFLNGTPRLEINAAEHSVNDWFVFNLQQRFYYRVNYDANNWMLLSKILSSNDFNKIHVMNRAQLIDDSFALVSAGYLEDYAVAYDIFKYLVNEVDFFPWYTANRYIGPLYNIFGYKNAVLNNFVKIISKNFYAKYKLPSNGIIPQATIPERYGRYYAMQLACNALNEQCLEDTFTLVRNYAEKDQNIPNGYENVLCLGIRGTGKQDVFYSIWKISMLTSNTELKTRILNSLGCTDDEVALFDLLESTLGSGSSNANYTLSTRQAVFTGSLQSKVIVPVFIKFMKKHPAYAVSYFRYTTAQLFTMVAETVRTREDQTMLMDFMANFDDLSGGDFKKISSIMSNALLRQQEQQYARQLELMGEIFPLNPDETTPKPVTPTSTSTSTLSHTTTSTATVTQTVTSSEDPETPTVTETVTTSPNTETQTTPTTVPTTIPTTSVPTTTEKPTTTTESSGDKEVTTPGNAVSINIKIITLISCLVLTTVLKY